MHHLTLSMLAVDPVRRRRSPLARDLPIDPRVAVEAALQLAGLAILIQNCQACDARPEWNPKLFALATCDTMEPPASKHRLPRGESVLQFARFRGASILCNHLRGDQRCKHSV